MSFSSNGSIDCRGITWQMQMVTPALEYHDLAVESATAAFEFNGASVITGFDPSRIAAADEKRGAMIWLVNTHDTQSITLPHDDVRSADGYRILTPDGLDAVVGPFRQAFLIYASRADGSRLGWWLFA